MAQDFSLHEENAASACTRGALYKQAALPLRRRHLCSLTCIGTRTETPLCQGHKLRAGMANTSPLSGRSHARLQ